VGARLLGDDGGEGFFSPAGCVEHVAVSRLLLKLRVEELDAVIGVHGSAQFMGYEFILITQEQLHEFGRRLI